MSELTANEIDLIGNTLEHQGLTDDEIDNYFLEHHGVKGQKWGVRRSKGRAAGRTQAIKKGVIRGKSRSEKAGMAFTATLLAATGFLTLAAIKM